MRDVPQLPATHAIADQQVRTFLDELSNAWAVRNGDVGDGSSKFLTAKDVANVSLKVMSSVLATVPGVSGLGGPTITGSNAGSGADAISDISRFISQTELFRRLGQSIAKITVPADLVKFIQGQVSAQADNITTLGTQVGKNQSAIVTEQHVRTTEISAVASAVNTIWGLVAGPGSTALAIAQDGQSIDVSAVAAQAVKWTQLQSAVFDANGNNLVASIRQDFSTYTSALDSKLDAMYTLRVDVNGLVGGFGIEGSAQGSLGPTINFGVRANTFFIAPPSDGSSFLGDSGTGFPFTVLTSPTTINGRVYQPGTYINNLIAPLASIDITQIMKLIYSDSWNGVGDVASGNITDGGTTGWAISRNGLAYFNNVVVRGTSVIGVDIRSSNFATGSQGWIIRQDGSAEFDSVMIRKHSWKSTTAQVAVDASGTTTTPAAVSFGSDLGYIPIVTAAGGYGGGGAVITSISSTGCTVDIIGIKSFTFSGFIPVTVGWF